MSRLHDAKTGKITIKYDRGGVSIRSGTRTKTQAKTARALGHNYTPTLSWRTRSQGKVVSTKMAKAGQIKGMKKQAKEIASGDKKPL